MEGPNNILFDVANEAKEAVDVAKEAVQSTFQDLKTEGMDAITKIGEYVSLEEVNCQMVLLVGLVMVFLGVIVCAGVKKVQEHREEEKGREENLEGHFKESIDDKVIK